MEIRPEIKQIKQADTAQARAMIYQALAEALAGPRQGIEKLLLDAATTGARLLDSPACHRATLTLAKSPVTSLETLSKEYARLITNPDRCPVALYESLHRQGCLMGRITRDVERHYRSSGLTPVDGELPDHASVELAYLGHLAATEAEAHTGGDRQLVARLRREQRDFLRMHAHTWLPDVGLVMAAASDPFYAAVGRLLSGFLTEELNGQKRRNQIGQHNQIGVKLPTLKNLAACTLCGLCTGSCSSGALRVIESETQTALALNPTQCTGCNRCAHICPEGVLFLSFVAETASPLGTATHSVRSTCSDKIGYQVIRRSPRAGCPKCNRPTVSQAELDAIFRRLQPDPVTWRRLSLCVECKSWPI